MKKLLVIVVLGLCFTTPSQAYDIRDFQIEGISVGESLLIYMSIDEINNKKFKFKNKKKYYVVKRDPADLVTYDYLDLYIKEGDEKYIVRSIGGFFRFTNFNKCLSRKKNIFNELKTLFPDAKVFERSGSHSFDKSGKSKQVLSAFLLEDSTKADHIRIDCVAWTKEMKRKYNSFDHLVVVVMTKEILSWTEAGYK